MFCSHLREFRRDNDTADFTRQGRGNALYGWINLDHSTRSLSSV